MHLFSKCRMTSFRSLKLLNSINLNYSTNILASQSLSEPIIFNKKDTNKSKLDDSTYVTKLDNGLSVASQNQFGFHATLGVFVKSAPRYEINCTSGVSHFIEKLAFQSSIEFPNKDEVDKVMDKCGAVFDCQLARDMIIYGVSGNLSNVDDMTCLLSDIVNRPLIKSDEVETARQIVEHEHQMMRLVPPPDNLLQDLIHQAAFGRNTLGLPRYTPLDNISKIQRSDIINYMVSTFRPENMVLVAVGCDHQVIVEAAKKYFLPKTDHLINDSDYNKEVMEIDQSVPQVTGGEMTIEQDLSQYHLPMPEMAHVSLALEGVSFNDPHFVAACVLQSLMGGGGSFSAGGPGKGMYSRLYTEVLNQHGFINSAIASNHSYGDGGLFTISGSCEPTDLKKLVQVIAKQMQSMGNIRNKEELERAKSLVRSSLLINLEMRAVVFEDMGRQMIYRQNKRHPIDYWVDAIEQVSEKDIADLVQRMMHSRPSLAAFGRLSHLPSLSEVNKMITSSETFIPKIFNKFH